MEIQNILVLVISIILVVAVGVPLINASISALAGAGSYSEILSLTNGTPGSASNYIDTVSSLYRATAFSKSNSTTDPGNATITLSAIPITTATLNVTGGNSGDVSINGHHIGTLNVSGGVFSVPIADLLIGSNSVVFG